ncbi:ABC transporter permease [Bradyrhizobium sp. dw_411]|uniref:ABC transporter permease n=1 Tax=Bradyrhizobium sp. dw_411 TaxID=2720082 RepID=UPI001BCD351B
MSLDRRFRLTQLFIPAVLAGAIVAVSFLEPRFLSSRNLINILMQAAPLVIASLGQAIIITAGDIDLSQGAVVALAGVAGVVVGVQTDSVLLAWLTVAVAGASLGALNGILVGWFKIPAFIATAGMLTYADGFAFLTSGGLPVEFPPDGYSWFGRGFIKGVPVSVPLMVITVLLCWLVMERTRVGRAIYLVGDNRDAARIVGLSPERYRLYAFCIGGFLTGLAAIVLTGRIDSAPPSLAPSLQFETIAAVAIGGINMTGGHGQIWRAALGAAPIAIVTNILNLLGVDTAYQLVVIGSVTIVVVAFQYVSRLPISLKWGLAK